MKRFVTGCCIVYVAASVWALADLNQTGRLTTTLGMLLAIKFVAMPVTLSFVAAMTAQFRRPLRMFHKSTSAVIPLLCGLLAGFLALAGTAVVLCAPVPPESDVLILVLATWLATRGVLRAFGRPRIPGRCPRCNYDISGSLNFGRCPECGGPLHETLGFLRRLPITARVVPAAASVEAPCGVIAVNPRR